MSKTSGTMGIEDLTKASIAMMEQQRYSREHIKRYRHIYNILEKYTVNNTEGKYCEQTGADFLMETSHRDLSPYSVACYKIAIKRLNGILAGATDWYPLRAEKEYALSCFDGILLNYESYQYSVGRKKWNIRADTAVVAEFLRFTDLYGIKDRKSVV